MARLLLHWLAVQLLLQLLMEITSVKPFFINIMKWNIKAKAIKMSFYSVLSMNLSISEQDAKPLVRQLTLQTSNTIIKSSCLNLK